MSEPDPQPLTITLGELGVSDAALMRLEQLSADWPGTREERVVCAIAWVAGAQIGLRIRMRSLEQALRDVLGATRAVLDALEAGATLMRAEGNPALVPHASGGVIALNIILADDPALRELLDARTLATDVLADQEEPVSSTPTDPAP